MSQAMTQHDRAYATCAACPKACHTSCPVSEVTGSETLSAWGKMNVAHAVLTGTSAMTEDASKAVHACTGCGRCSSFCQHGNQPATALFAAREATIHAATQPAGSSSTVATFLQSQNPLGADLTALVAPWRATSAVRHQLFPGCVTLAKQSDVIDDTLTVAAAFGAPMAVARNSSMCCGYPLYAAGSMEQFRAHAQQFVKSFDMPPELLVLDPGCVMTLKTLYARVGVRLSARVRTAVEVLAENLPHAPVKPPLPESVAYHDACHLGRGLGQYEEPRALLQRAVRHTVEAVSSRNESGCSGGGGLLPRTQPDVAVEIAKSQVGQFAGAFTSVATTCTTSKRMFERAGHRSEHLMSVLKRWLEST